MEMVGDLMVGIEDVNGGVVWQRLPNSTETWKWIDQQLDDGLELIVERAYAP